jgi:serine protease Do
VDESEILKRLGFTVQDLTEELAHRLGYEGQKGVVVAEVKPGSDAALMGLSRGTLIREVDRQPVHNTAEFMQALARSQQTQRVLRLAQDRRGSRFIALDLG